MGEVTGLFVADEKDVEKAIGSSVYFGEILGKHSEIYGTLEEKDVVVKSDDQDFITKFVAIVGNRVGYNPLDYIREDE
jgi:hypothetical protein